MPRTGKSRKQSAAQTCASIIRGGWINPDLKKENEKIVRELLREDRQRKAMERAILDCFIPDNECPCAVCKIARRLRKERP